MSKAFIVGVLQESAELSRVVAMQVAGDLMAAIVSELKNEGKFSLPGFGSFVPERTWRHLIGNVGDR
jgi:DNA-binding protein HU-beta